MTESAKQVIVIRKDLKMRRGKEIAQGAHASCAFITNRLRKNGQVDFSKAEAAWVEGSFAKVCLQVSSEEELLAVFNKAKEAGLVVHLITDSGKTEFGGVPTKTCLAIGPDWPSKIDPVTGDLKLY